MAKVPVTHGEQLQKWVSPSGATSRSKAPDYSFCPKELELDAIDRFWYGTNKIGGHAKDNWRKGKDDPIFQRERLNHAKTHLNRIIDDTGDYGDFQAVVCNLAMLSWWKRNGTGFAKAFPNMGTNRDMDELLKESSEPESK